MTRKHWTAADIELLRAEYPDTPTAVLADRFGVTERAVYNRARKLGLKKSDAYLASPAACRLRRGDNIGGATRFPPGHRPHNAGLKGWRAGGRSAVSQFKPGNRPHTWQPIGSERTTDEGYLQRKLTDTGNTRRDWVCLHVLAWEAVHGPVPRGQIVVFKNRDKRDIRLENLELITRAENMRRNSIHRLPKELADVCRLKGALQRAIEKRARNEKQD